MVDRVASTSCHGLEECMAFGGCLHGDEEGTNVIVPSHAKDPCGNDQLRKGCQCTEKLSDVLNKVEAVVEASDRTEDRRIRPSWRWGIPMVEWNADL